MEMTSINFNDANVGGAGGDNVLSAEEIFNYLKGQSANDGKNDDQIKAMMQNLTINVDKNASAVTFDLDDAVAGSVIDFDRLNINDGNENATDFTIFVADTDGLIINTQTVGAATSDPNGVSDIASVNITDSSNIGMTYASNALSVTLDNTDWEDNGVNAAGQYQLTYDIDNNVTLTNAVAGFGNSITVEGDMVFEQTDENGLNNGIINVKLDISSTVATDLIYDVNITDTVSTLDNVSNLAGGVEVHVYQDNDIKSTRGNVSVDTDTTIGRETSRRNAYGYQLQNWVNERAVDAPPREIIYNGVTRNEAWISGMAAAMLNTAQANPAPTEYEGVNISAFVTALQNQTVGIPSTVTNTTATTGTLASGWTIGTSPGSWHGFYLTTDPTHSNEANSGGTFYLPPAIYDKLKATYPATFGALNASNNTSASYSNYGSNTIAGLTIDVTGLNVKDAAGNVLTGQQSVMNLIAGGGTIAVTTNVTSTSTGIKSGTIDNFELYFGNISSTASSSSSVTNAVCRNCDPVAMIIFEQASGDLSALRASTDNDMFMLGRDYTQRAVGDPTLSEKFNVEMQTGVLMGGAATAGVTDGVSAYINQTVSTPESGSGQVYNVTGRVGDEATYVENYTTVAAQVQAGQTHDRVNDSTTRVSDALRAFLLANPTIDIDNHDTYNDALATFLLSDSNEMSTAVFNNMTTAYLEGKVTAENFAALLTQKVTNNNDMFQVFMNLGIADGANVGPKIVDLFDHMSTLKPTPTTKSTLEIGIDTLMNYAVADAVAAIYYQMLPATATAFNTAFEAYFGANGPRSTELADALVKGLNRNPSAANVDRVAGLIFDLYPSDDSVGYMVTALEANWDPTVFAQISAAMMDRTTVEASDFKEVNMLLSKITKASGTELFESMKAQALGGDLKVQAYLRESVVAASRGIVNDLDSVLGEFQTAAILEAAGQNLDKGGNLDIFGLNSSGQALLNVDSIILASENLYKTALEEGKTEIIDRLVNQILTGAIGFDLNTQSGTAQYFNNIKRIAFISQGREGTLLSAVGKCSAMSGYLGSNSNIMNSSTSATINKLVGITGFIGSTGSSYYVQFVDLSMSDLGVLANEGGDDSYAATYGSSYRALSILGSNDRSSLGIALDYTQDVTDWVFSTTHNLLGDDGTPRDAADVSSNTFADLDTSLNGKTDAREISAILESYIAANNISIPSTQADVIAAREALKTGVNLLQGNIFLYEQQIMAYLETL